jgi:serine/threonine protein kinase
VLKIQSRSEHTRELHVLQRLRAIDGIVQVLDFFECIDGFVLVLPRLAPIDFANLRSSDTQISQFVHDAVSVVMKMHSRGVAHGDIKPSAFMLDRCTSAVILLDFNLSCLSTERLGGRLSGTPGWVFDDAPAIVGSDIDRVGLAGVIGWLVGVDAFGDADSNFDDAVTSIKRHVTNVSFTIERRCLLRLVESLLCTRVPLPDLLARVQSGVVTCAKTSALRASLPVSDAVSHDKENLPTARTASDGAGASVVKATRVEAARVEAVQLRR